MKYTQQRDAPKQILDMKVGSLAAHNAFHKSVTGGVQAGSFRKLTRMHMCVFEISMWMRVGHVQGMLSGFHAHVCLSP